MYIDGHPLVWQDSNLRHLAEHPERSISQAEVEEVMHDPNRHEEPDPRHGSTVVVGQTAAGRMLVVAWVEHPQGRMPIHFRQSGKRTRRKL